MHLEELPWEEAHLASGLSAYHGRLVMITIARWVVALVTGIAFLGMVRVPDTLGSLPAALVVDGCVIAWGVRFALWVTKKEEEVS